MTADDAALERLADQALAVMERAYAPYSGFRVGAALLLADGSVVTGANVENASYPASLCAERAALGAAVSGGSTEFVAIAVATEAEHPTPPCGFCRQALVEFAPALTVVSVTRGGARAVWPLEALLPHAFTPKSLRDRK